MNHTYALIPITLAVVILYVVSWVLTKTGEISRITHRRIWNTLLLITFLVAGLLGIMLVIQINYKLEIPRIRQLLKWHVDFGIAMVCIALIHLAWHIRYYGDALASLKNNAMNAKPSARSAEFTVAPDVSKRNILTALFVLGFTAILSQLIVIREFLNVFQGNELIIGLILSTWMLLTAAGARWGQRLLSRSPGSGLTSRLFLLSGILPAAVVFLLYLLETLLFPPGTSKGLFTAFAFCLVLLLPFCMVSGVLFTMLASQLSAVSGKNSVSKAYSLESAGSTLAGVLFSLCLAYLLDTFQLLALLAAINILWYTRLIQQAHRNRKSYILPGLLLAGCVVMAISPVDLLVKSFHYKNQELAYSRDTPYGNVAVTRTAGQYNFYENGNLLFSTENNLMHEEAVHFTLLQRARPEKVLVISGGITGMAAQVLKYSSVTCIDYLEINPWLVEAERRYSDTVAPALHIITGDARRLIRRSSPAYDAILVNTPDPSNAQINRYYTLEFFREAAHALRPGGVFSISLSPADNYMSADARDINRVLYHTLHSVFRHVEVIPGERNYYVASADTIAIDIAARVQHAGIENDYINPYYIEDDLLKQHNSQLMEEIAGDDAPLNADLAPRAYFLQIRYWLGIFGNRSGKMLMLILMPMLGLMLLALRRMSAVAAGVFTGGFAGASAEFLVLIVFQIFFGYIYQMLGIIVAFYMIGLTAGAAFRVNRNDKKTTVRSYLIVQGILLLLMLFIPLLSRGVGMYSAIPGWTVQACLFIITAAVAFVAGLEFNMACRLEQQKIENVAGNLYAVDLAGAAGGTLLTSLVFFPLLGLGYTCLLLAALIMVSMIVLVVSGKRYG